jgi:ubiquinone/menaquinone biosynthesis C-methylase UbiE
MALPRRVAARSARTGAAALRRGHDLLTRLAARLEGTPRATAASITRQIGDDWKQSGYYDAAENAMDRLWDTAIWPMISDADFSVVVDLAAGHGRNTEKLRQHARTVYVADINHENIVFCRERFRGDDRIKYILCDGMSLPTIPDRSVSLVYSFDAMVHFDSDTIRAYLAEFHRVLTPRGRGFCHHSNYVGSPAGDFHESPHWRNFMSKELFEHYCHKEGLTVLRSRLVDWGAPALDCMTVFERR